MNLGEVFRVAMRALGANKARAALTMLGVVIGVAAVILLVAIGQGVERELKGQVEGLGSNLLFVMPGQIDTEGGSGYAPVDVFRLDDAELLQRRLGPEIPVVPILQASAGVRRAGRSMRAVIAAGNESGEHAFTATLEGGRHYRRGEVVAGARVVALAATPAEKLFPGQSPVGKSVTVNGSPFRVIGYYEKQGGSLGSDQDNQLYMPITTAQRLLGVDTITSMAVKAPAAEQVESVRARIRRILRPRFGTEFSVFSQEQFLGFLSKVLDTLTLMLAGIAGISLLVGGIGIMNIMLVSVTERTREIGIRKAVGARTHDILGQFVVEAVMLSVTGGAVGIVAGVGGAAVLRRWVPTEVTAWAVAMAFSFAFGVGVFFGVYPAYRASKLDPIEALRYE